MTAQFKTVFRFNVRGHHEPAAGLPGFSETVEVRLAGGIHEEHAAELADALRQTLGEFYDAAVTIAEVKP